MSTILFIDSHIPKLDVLKNATKVDNYINFEYETIDYTNVFRIGFIWQNSYGLMPFGSTPSTQIYKYFTNEFLKKYFLNFLKKNH